MEQASSFGAEPEQQESMSLDSLRQQLKIRDQLVNQLSSQLFKMVQAYPPALPQAPDDPTGLAASRRSVTLEEVQALEQQISFYQDQIDQRDRDIAHLKQSCQDLSDRNQTLERVVQDLPEVYRRQFQDRLEQYKVRMRSLQAENKKLRAELGYRPAPDAPEGQKRRLFLPSKR